jgi:UDP-N-acetylmuramate--alanine ligase
MEALFLDQSQTLYKMSLALNGHHNVLNALGVFAMVQRLGFEPLQILEALATFTGVDRRCQIKGLIGQCLWIDDYGHHPTEIKTTLKGIKERYKDRTIAVVFQPHRYTRTYDLWDQFYESFGIEDELIVTDIYGAHEPNQHNLKAEDLAHHMAQQLGKPVIYKSRGDLKEHLFDCDIVVTFGAGDITALYQEHV